MGIQRHCRCTLGHSYCSHRTLIHSRSLAFPGRCRCGVFGVCLPHVKDGRLVAGRFSAFSCRSQFLLHQFEVRTQHSGFFGRFERTCGFGNKCEHGCVQPGAYQSLELCFKDVCRASILGTRSWNLYVLVRTLSKTF